MTRKEYYDALLYAEAYLDNAFAGNATDIAEDDDNDDINKDKRRETIEALKKKINLANIMDKEA